MSYSSANKFCQAKKVHANMINNLSVDELIRYVEESD